MTGEAPANGTGTKPPPSVIPTLSNTSLNRIPFQLGGSSNAVRAPFATREASRVNPYSRYALPSVSKRMAPDAVRSLLSPASYAPVVSVTSELPVGCSLENLPATNVAMATLSRCDSFCGVPPNMPTSNRLGTLLRRAHHTSTHGHTGSVNCPTSTSCPTPVNCPAPVGDPPPTKCRHSKALDYLVSAVCPGQHWKAQEVAVQCMMLQCRGGRGARGHGT